MKKSILLLTAGLFAGLANAQQAQQNVTNNKFSAPGQTMKPVDIAVGSTPMAGPYSPAPAHSGARVTVGGPGGGRWYNYVDHLFTPYRTSVLTKDVGYYGYTMWNDTTALVGYTTSAGTPEYDFAQMISGGLGLDPTYSSSIVPGYGWNECGITAVHTDLDFTGAMGISQYDPYTVDSVFVGGWYTRCTTSAAKNLVVDTLILTFVKSDRYSSTGDLATGTLTTGVSVYGVVSLTYRRMWHDIANNRAAHNGGGAVSASAVYKFPMTLADSNSNANDIAKTQYPRSGHPSDPAINFPVGANEIMAVSVTYKSGDNTYGPTGGQPGDTLRYSNGTAITGYKYNTYQIQVNYAQLSSSSTTADDYPMYDPNNASNGHFGFEGGNFPGASTNYYPNWTIIGVTSSGSVPSAAQFPRIAFHAKCAACIILPSTTLSASNITDLKNITVTPNPANDMVNISFGLNKGANATVSLTNMVGQVVASKVVTSGNAAFNTSALPAGIYVYSVEVDGENATGRVVVSH